ncbi:peptidyl-prolyl cis-trans isomerase [Bacillus sp. PS06]|uniref:peptidyl-prolyl cis-trans isomerase n=1 Tax=Bacillus sp. PS06 TaxID=2764176 RepID=UPI0017870E92|nr:peptidyl-prolyl cis-trans isomerase [Bacillus sp. PS06]MBD8068436.1 peptidyl-prolyl cis-trans isomerase [Bacillus sp. PS06]
MESIILLTGNVKYNITLDPGVWIFDDRRVDLTTYFDAQKQTEDQLEKYTKEVSAHWDREIKEGAIVPPTKQSEKKYKKEQILTGTFGIPFHDFLKHSSPAENAESLKIITDQEPVIIPINKAYDAILGFSLKGKPLREDGPVHFYYGDGSNRDNPIKNISEFIIE